MKTKSFKKDKINVVTLGCAKNIFDSEVLMGQLRNNSFNVVHDSYDYNSSIVIINTCGFIENAKQESIDTILQYIEEKKQGHIDKLFVTGCLSERYKKELTKDIPEVDAYFGTQELPQLLKKLNADYKQELLGERLLTTPSHYSYFKIAEGCDRPCSFCAIPLIRGKHTSFPMEQLLKDAKTLANTGTKELILIAQDLTFYGLDIYGKRKLAELLKYLSDIEGIEWIRLHYAFPSGFPLDILDVMKERSNICNYLDIPIQHISDNILKAMKRGITKDKTIELINTIREKVPDIAIRTTLMTGYPNETEEDFFELTQWVKETKFDRLGVFTYSHEEDTAAYQMKDNVSKRTKQKRADEIMSIQNEISLQINQNKIGKTFKVLFDRKEGEYYVGRTEYDSPDVDNEVLVSTLENNIRIGDFYDVSVINAEAYDLFGKVIKE